MPYGAGTAERWYGLRVDFEGYLKMCVIAAVFIVHYSAAPGS